MNNPLHLQHSCLDSPPPPLPSDLPSASTPVTSPPSALRRLVSKIAPKSEPYNELLPSPDPFHLYTPSPVPPPPPRSSTLEFAQNSSNQNQPSDDESHVLSSDILSISIHKPKFNDFLRKFGEAKLKIVTCVPASDAPPPPPRISFSFPVPRISFAKGSVSPASNAKLRSCDVYIGFHGQNPNLVRFSKWHKSELEIQGIACFVADRAKYSDNQSHEIANRVICSVTFGVVVVTNYSLCNHLSLEEIRFFAQKKNLIPLF